MVKLVLTWDVQDGKTEKYVEFTVSEFLPALGRMGVRVTGTWVTIAGKGPQVRVTGLTNSTAEVQQLLDGQEYHALKQRLLDYVEHYHEKVVAVTNGNTQF